MAELVEGEMWVAEGVGDVDEETFARAVINYVEKNTDTRLADVSEGDIPDHWTVYGEGINGLPSSSCLVHHGLFDSVFSRRAIQPRRWSDFERQYLSIEADLLERMYQECQQLSVTEWQPDQQERNPFPMTGDFWTSENQKKNFQGIVKGLVEKDIVVKPNRFYRDDLGAFGVKMGDKVVDFPGTYDNLRSLVEGMNMGHASGRDIPQDLERYGSHIPVIYMVGTTTESKELISEDEELTTDQKIQLPMQKFELLVKEYTSPTPKSQSIVYVLADKEGGVVKPRHVGSIYAFMLEFAYRSPAGHIHSDMIYHVPKEDLSEEEMQNIQCSHSNWGMHHSTFLQNHPKILGEVRRIVL